MATVRQELPPPGGYAPFRFARNLPKRGPSGLTIMIGGVGVMIFGFYLVRIANRQRRAERKETLYARLALVPLLQAELDRRTLRGMKAFEEEEAAIMKDVPGWEVGESTFHTEKWIPPHPAIMKEVD